MKKLLLSSVALLGLTVGATAADLPRSVVAPAPVVPVPVFTWTGFYIGANAGYGWHDDNNDDVLNNGFGFNGFGTGLAVQTNAGLQPVAPLTGFNNFGFFDNGRRGRDGFVGGGQIGYNFQFTPGSGFVVGIEADAQYADFRRNDDDCFFGGCGFGGFGGFGTTGFITAAPVAPIAPGSGIANPTGVGNGALGNVALFNSGGFGTGFGFNGRRDIEWFGTVRGRVGYAWDRLLVYATGGAPSRTATVVTTSMASARSAPVSRTARRSLARASTSTQPLRLRAVSKRRPTLASSLMTAGRTTGVGRWAVVLSMPSPNT